GFVRSSLVDPAAGDPGVCGGEVEVFAEPLATRQTLLVIGGGHVGKAIVHLAHWLGFRVVVWDDRADYSTPESVPEADEYLHQPIGDLVRTFPFGHDTAIVMPTRGVPVDTQALPLLLD